jgi:hypothetical protein
VAKRNSGRRSRSRKRRSAQAGPSPAGASSSGARPPAGAPETTAGAGAGSGPGPLAQRSRAAQRRTRPARREPAPFHDPGSVGERPRAPWHPWPLSELVILVGAIGVVVAWRRGIESNATLLVAGILAVAIGTIEVSLREHLSGYRSHTILLAVLPPIVFHTGVTLLVLAFTTVPRWLFAALLPIDAAIFAALFKLLRARFVDARRERVFEQRR